MIKGIAAAPGLAIAKCLVLEDRPVIDYTQERMTDEETECETEKLEKAVGIVEAQLSAIRMRAEADGVSDRVEIMEAHIMMLKDPLLSDAVKEKIMTEYYTAAGAVQQTIEEQVAVFEAIDDPYFRERALDIRDIGRRLLNSILGIAEKDLSDLSEDVILVAKDITPSQMASADIRRVKGVVAEIGGKTSHTAIMARNMDIPAVLGIKDADKLLEDGMRLAVNGSLGTVETGLSDERINEIVADIKKQEQAKKAFLELKDVPTITKDGFRVELSANIMQPEGAVKAVENGAEGIGLYRTEFLYMDRNTLPDEEEQYDAYREVLEKMAGKPVIIRTMDIGGDKSLDCLNLPKEENPFLGYRAIRICLNDKELFKAQLRAILRASSHGNALIMYPMIASPEEIAAANAVLEEAKAELRQEGKAFDEGIRVGIMIEIPSAAMTADILIKDVDFFSIGTNDLTQYTLAVDRMNEKISSLYNYFQPGVLRLIQTVIEAANSAGSDKFAGMCGEMAGDPVATLLLLGMGLKEFSVNPTALLKIRKIITSVDMAYARKVAQKAMEMSRADEIEAYLKQVTDEILGC